MALREPWWPEHDEIIRRAYPHNPTVKLAKLLGRSERAVYMRAATLNVKKSPEYLAKPEAGRLRGNNPNSVAHRFKKGQESWSKGTKGRVGVQPGCRRTQFKKGHLGGRAAEKYQPIGTERVSKDGYTERKLHDGLPLQSRWRGVHLIRWEAINGPLPPGHALVFKDGDKANTDPENMELVTRAELMRRNSYHNRYPKEVGLLIQLRGAVNRKINRRSKQA